MIIKAINKYNCAFVTTEQLLEGYKAEKFEQGKIVSNLRKNSDGKEILKQKSIIAPVSMRKMLNLLDVDGYHSGACSAISEGVVMHIRNKSAVVDQWLKDSQNPVNLTRAIRSAIVHYQACGNGFLLKLRDRSGSWIGLELLPPQEIEIKENIDEYGFLRPNYVQHRAGKSLLIPNKDMIHIKKPTYKSNAWGLSSLPVALSVETLKEIKDLDYNNFKNGLLIDYFIVVSGGSLTEGDGDEEEGTYSQLERMLKEAVGTKGGHSSILLETSDVGAKIELIPLRQTSREGEFKQLKEDIRNEMLAYHRVPKRLIAQTTSGQLGGDNNSDMVLFYNFVVKPIQDDLAEQLSEEFTAEFGWNVEAEDWDFGDLTEVFLSEEDRVFKLGGE